MATKVDVISRTILKPSSPTPSHLKTFKLSLFDQLAPPLYMPIVLFYPSQCDQETVRLEKSTQLKESLSQTLTHFFPLAGRLKDGEFCVDCSDEGIHYFEARVGGLLSDVLEQPEVELLNQFLPFGSYSGKTPLDREVLLAVQFNTFECGGMAIGVCVSHKLGDGATLVTLVNAWAATSRGATSEALPPSFDAATLFPPVSITGFGQTTGIITEEKIVTKRFVFDASAIARLREGAVVSNESQMKLPTRVQAVSALIWKHIMAAAGRRSGSTKAFAALHAVNVRGRMVPPLPQHSFGNLWRFAVSPPPPEKKVNEYSFLVQQLREAIEKIDGDYMKTLQSDIEGHLNSMKQVVEAVSTGQIVFCNFSSWCRFPFYEVDFGWGKPIWVCTTNGPYNNVVILTSTRRGDGIEACVNMLEEDMAMLELDQEFFSFISSQRITEAADPVE